MRMVQKDPEKYYFRVMFGRLYLAKQNTAFKQSTKKSNKSKTRQLLM